MSGIGFLLIGVVAGLALLAVFAGLTWAAIQDGRDAHEVRPRLPRPALVPAGARG